MVELGWITFHTAAAEIERRLGVSGADAQARLRQARRDEKIRAMKAPYDGPDDWLDALPFEFWTPLAPSDWRSREPDFDGPDEDGCPIEVMLKEADFEFWLSSNDISTFQPQKLKDPRRAAIIKRLRTERPGQPGGVTWSVFCESVRRDVGMKATERGYNDQTITKLTRGLIKNRSK